MSTREFTEKQVQRFEDLDNMSYEKRCIYRYPLKLNKTEDEEILKLWHCVKNKSACLHYLLENYLEDYIDNEDEITLQDMDESSHRAWCEARELELYQVYVNTHKKNKGGDKE